MRRAEEARVDDRALEAGFPEDVGHLLRVRIDRELAQASMNSSKSTVVWRFSTGSGFEPGASSAVTTRCASAAAPVAPSSSPPQPAERDECRRCEEWDREAHGPSILRSAAALHKASAARVCDTDLLHCVRRGGGTGETRLP